ncbi:MAG: flagellar basal body P-ring formation chaperone FlgA [Acidobacteriota bacterium]
MRVALSSLAVLALSVVSPSTLGGTETTTNAATPTEVEKRRALRRELERRRRPRAERTTTTSAAATVSAPGAELELQAPLRRGEPLTGRHLVGGAIPPELVGSVARRHLRPGQVLRASDFVAPPMVERGERVTAFVRRGPLVVTLDAKVLEDGAHGAEVRLTNQRTGARLVGRVVSPGVVEVSSR